MNREHTEVDGARRARGQGQPERKSGPRTELGVSGESSGENGEVRNGGHGRRGESEKLGR